VAIFSSKEATNASDRIWSPGPTGNSYSFLVFSIENNQFDALCNPLFMIAANAMYATPLANAATFAEQKATILRCQVSQRNQQ
jgi:hypothetical protein